MGCECDVKHPIFASWYSKFTFVWQNTLKRSNSGMKSMPLGRFSAANDQGAAASAFLHRVMRPPPLTLQIKNKVKFKLQRNCFILVHIMTLNRRCFDATFVLDCEGFRWMPNEFVARSYRFNTRFYTFTTERVTSSQWVDYYVATHRSVSAQKSDDIEVETLSK